MLEKLIRGTNIAITEREAKAMGIENLSARMSEFRAKGLRVRVGKNRAGETTYKVSSRSLTGSEYFKFN